MTVLAPHESKMFEAMIQSLDPASGTAKVKFAKVSFQNAFLSKNLFTSFFSMVILTLFLYHNYQTSLGNEPNVEGTYIIITTFTQVPTKTFRLVVGQKTSQH